MEQTKSRHPVAICLLCLILFLLGYFTGLGFLGKSQSVSAEPQREWVFVIDAGHGGEDCGAIGVNGVLEKDLNLSIAKRLGAMLNDAGCTVVYTREDDRLLYTEAQNIKGQRKIWDLKNRKSIAKRFDNAILISIHMNAFHQSKYRGFQVYYANNPISRFLGEKLQNKAVAHLQPWNNRKAKQGDSSIYLLADSHLPAVLIECGFLSNPEECALLCQEDYQKRLCFSIFCAMIELQEKTLQGEEDS